MCWRGAPVDASLGRVAGRPEGFEYVEQGDDVVVLHHGRRATVLRGRRARAFLEDVEGGDPQELMARVTGNYRRGNERRAGQHPRNRNR
jgi:hypothetical protein